jgi:hypothetical protein
VAIRCEECLNWDESCWDCDQAFLRSTTITKTSPSKLYYSEREHLRRARAGQWLSPEDAAAILERLGRVRGATKQESAP